MIFSSFSYNCNVILHQLQQTKLIKRMVFLLYLVALFHIAVNSPHLGHNAALSNKSFPHSLQYFILSPRNYVIFIIYILIYYANIVITRVPIIIKQRPIKAFLVNLSLNTRYENSIEIMMLNLSIGTTTLTIPF